MADDDKKAAARVHKEVKLSSQSRIIDAANHIRISNKLREDKLIDRYYDGISTLYDVFMRGCRVSGSEPCIGARPDKNSQYKWLTYNDVKERATHFGSGLVHFGLEACNDQFIGIYAKNMIEWIIAEKGTIFYSMVLIPLYNTLGDQAMRFVMQQTEMAVVIIENGKALGDFKRDVLDHEEGACIKKIILIEATDADTMLIEQIQNGGTIKVHTFKEIEACGKANPKAHVLPKPDDLAVINYTSGTTGNPKGVMLTHANFVADAAGGMYIMPRPFAKTDVWYSYLPLPHVFERMVQVALFQVGARIGFFGGDIRDMPSDLQMLKPTIFGGVPRVWTRFYDKIKNAGAGSWFKTTLLNMALNSKIKEVEKGVCRRNSMYDKIVFKKVQQLLGGRVEMALTGAAPIAPEVLNVLRAAFGAYVIEGYGQTECSAGCSGTLPGDHSGSVGSPFVCNEIRLDDVPEMNYFANENAGEICVRGLNVMKGYYKDPVKTAETIDENGWLHTGDIGIWQANGSLKIVDRKKNIFKLAQGEYIAPEKIENIYIRSSACMQVFVHGESLQAQLVVFCVPDPESFMDWCKQRGVNGSSIAELCKKPEVKKMVLGDLNDIGKKSNLKTFELAKNIHLDPEPWSVEADLLTPTFKTKRPQLTKFYQADIDRMYKELNGK